MTSRIGWIFPPTGGGARDGYNDSGIAHFRGAPVSSLARETIQNSLDARSRIEEPVHVSFELIELDHGVNYGRKELSRAIAACLRSPDCKGQAETELEIANGMLAESSVPCLRVSDRNTTGLRDDQWRALVKTRGLSVKAEQGAGGSHGIGKAAPFAVTPLRTVFYWTHYEGNDGPVERFQGKSVLMSHVVDGSETQGTGFYGLREGCLDVREGFPEAFRLLSQDGAPVGGTALHILGFRGGEDWRRLIARSVVRSYFYAIWTGKLDVIVDPDEEDEEDEELERLGLYQIDAPSLGKWFDILGQDNVNEDVAEEGGSSLDTARALWDTVVDGKKPIEKQDSDLGHCRLWIDVAEGLPNRVGFVRSSGMLITTQQRNLIRFPGFRDFAALCVFEDPEGNELLRLMENPQHDQFEPDRLPEDQQSRGRRALKRITDWIRSEIRKRAGPSETTTRTVLSELAAYLPDLIPDEDFDDEIGTQEGSNEPGFADRVKIRLRPARVVVPSRQREDEEGGEVEGDGEDTGDHGGGGEENGGGGGHGNGSGEGEGSGGTGGKSGRTKRKLVPVSAVRLLPLAGHANRYRMSFRPERAGIVRLELDEAGDSSSVVRRDVSLVDANGNCTLLHERVQKALGERPSRSYDYRR